MTSFFLPYAEDDERERIGSEERTRLSERARKRKSKEGQLEITEAQQQHISEISAVHHGDELQQPGEMVDVDERLAEVMEAELRPLDNSLSTPALQLMAFQRDAQGSHLLEVGEVLARSAVSSCRRVTGDSFADAGRRHRGDASTTV